MERPEIREDAVREDLRPEREHDVGIERTHRIEHALGVGAVAEVDEVRLDAGRTFLHRAGGEVRRLPDEHEPQRRPVGVSERVCRRRAGVTEAAWAQDAA